MSTSGAIPLADETTPDVNEICIIYRKKVEKKS